MAFNIVPAVKAVENTVLTNKVLAPKFKAPIKASGAPIKIQSTATSGTEVQGYRASKRATYTEMLIAFEKLASEISFEELEAISQEILKKI